MNAMVEMPIMSVQAMTDRINAIQEVTRKKMIVDVHYGIIPGTKKPTLYKAGSEMLLVMFQIGPRVDVLDQSSGERIKYRVTTSGIHIPTDRFVGQGIGSCSSGEEKYKWRNAICDDEFFEAPEEFRRVRWNRGKNGTFYRSNQIRTVPDDLDNTVLKMAKKRAQIDMTLTALGVSDLFEQDVEDMPEELRQSGSDHADAAFNEHAGMKAAKTVQELAKIMSGLKQDEKKKYVAYFNVRNTELKEAAHA